METGTLLILFLTAVVFLVIGYVIGRKLAVAYWKAKLLPQVRKEAAQASRAVLGGQFSEQLAPYLPDFPYHPTEARFLGKPVDFLVFKGMDQKDIQEVVFVEVKSGRSRLNSIERQLKKAVQENRVSWREYRIPSKVTQKP